MIGKVLLTAIILGIVKFFLAKERFNWFSISFKLLTILCILEILSFFVILTLMTQSL